jgi:lysine biosynthesis protein LysW
MENKKANCPICDSEIEIPAGTEESEIINCPHCNNRVLVAKITENEVFLQEAPEIEEDWGE